MLQCVDVLARADVPDLDCEVAGCGGQDIFGRGVEEDLPDLSSWRISIAGADRILSGDSPRVTSELVDGSNMWDLLSIDV